MVGFEYDFDLLLLDEPVSGVNPDMVNVILEKIKELKGFGKKMLFELYLLEESWRRLLKSIKPRGQLLCL